MPTEDQKNRLTNIMGWLRSAKENLPAINHGMVAADSIAQASALLDRMHRIAVALHDQTLTATAIEPARRAA